MSTSAALEDVLFLIEQGEEPGSIAARLGVKADSVGRLLHRHGRTTEARAFWRAARRVGAKSGASRA